MRDSCEFENASFDYFICSKFDSQRAAASAVITGASTLFDELEKT